MLFFWTFCSSKNIEKDDKVSTKILTHNIIIGNKKSFFWRLVWFVKDYVTFKTVVMADKFSFTITGIN